MALFDDLTKKAAKFTETAIDKTQEVAGNAKIKLKIKNLETDRDDIFRELGKHYFDIIKDDDTVDDFLTEKKTRINELSIEIEDLKRELNED